MTVQSYTMQCQPISARVPHLTIRGLMQRNWSTTTPSPLTDTAPRIAETAHIGIVRGLRLARCTSIVSSIALLAARCRGRSIGAAGSLGQWREVAKSRSASVSSVRNTGRETRRSLARRRPSPQQLFARLRIPRRRPLPSSTASENRKNSSYGDAGPYLKWFEAGECTTRWAQDGQHITHHRRTHTAHIYILSMPTFGRSGKGSYSVPRGRCHDGLDETYRPDSTVDSHAQACCVLLRIHARTDGEGASQYSAGTDVLNRLQA